MRKFAVIAIWAMVFAPTAFAAGPYGSIEIGNWKGGAYTKDADGSFSHCAAGATYKSGIYLIVSINSGGAWTLGFVHQSWRLNSGEIIPISLAFDGQHQLRVRGNAISANFVAIPMPENSTLISTFRKSLTMKAIAKGSQFAFDLKSTAMLLPALANCVAFVNANGIASADGFSIRTTASGEPIASIAASAGSSLKPGINKPVPQEYQVEAIEIASNFLMNARLHNPQIVSRTETPVELALYGAAWKSEEAFGFVRIIPTSTRVKGLDVTGAIVGNDAKECKGKFASGRKSELADSDVVFRGFSTCEELSGTRLSQYFILPRRKGGFVMFSVVSNMKTESERNVMKEEKLIEIRKAALITVSQ